MRSSLSLALAFLAASALIIGTGHAGELRERPEWKRHFDAAGSRGTLVVYDQARDTTHVFDAERARKAFIPASTFKIPNSLIALEAKVLRDERQILPWDGETRSIASWNRPHTLRTALRESVVPVYQAFARAVGERRMRRSLAKLDYGNRDIGGGIDRFWLDGALRISAIEQIAFLRRLQRHELPVSERAQRIVTEALINEAGPEFVLRAKTGWAARMEPGIGWWVGWVERDDNVFFFALNMDIADESQLGARKSIVRTVLLEEGMLP